MSENETNRPSKLPEEIVRKIKTLITKQNEELELKNTLKELQTETKDLKEQVHEYMKRHDFNQLNTPQGSLVRKTRIKRSGVTKDHLISCLSNCGELKDQGKAEGIVKYIYDQRTSEEVEELKRTT